MKQLTRATSGGYRKRHAWESNDFPFDWLKKLNSELEGKVQGDISQICTLSCKKETWDKIVKDFEVSNITSCNRTGPWGGMQGMRTASPSTLR